MKHAAWTLFLGLGMLIGCDATTVSRLSYYGHDSKQAYLAFDTLVQIPLATPDVTTDQDDLEKTYKDTIATHIDAQLKHMHGVFSVQSRPFDFISHPGTIRGNPRIEILAVKKLNPSLLQVNYRHTDLSAFKEDILKRSQLTTHALINGRSLQAVPISFWLPKMPGDDGFLIYEKGCPSGKASRETGACVGKINRCTDLHYNTYGDFWYFWDPKAKNDDHPSLEEPRSCPITQSDLVRVSAGLVPLSGTSEEHPSYPDYYRLYKKSQKQGKPTVRIDYYAGVEDTFAADDVGKIGFYKTYDILRLGNAVLATEPQDICKDPKISYDDRPSDCRFTTGEVKRYLSDTDFIMQELSNAAEIERLYGEKAPLMRELPYRKYLQYENKSFRVVLRMRLIQSSNIDNYLSELQASFRDADVFMYDGHSGLGGNFAVDRIFPPGVERPRKNKYQIYMFNGCSTFTYYNNDYFKLKATKKDPYGFASLDIITNSIGSLFSIGSANDTTLIRHLSLGDEPHWRSIIDDIFQSEPAESALAQVNGDEVNPRKQLNGKCRKDFAYDERTGMCEASDSLLRRPASWVDFLD